MKQIAMKALLIVLAAGLAGTTSRAQPASQQQIQPKGHTMHATGTFEVKTLPVEASAIGKDAGVGRMTIDKVWTGDIEGTSKGEMLTGITADTGSMAYTAVEKVTGKLAGKSGSFYFVHRATMMKADPASAVLEITVVPSSGTGELAGLTGSLKIDMSGGGHRYDFSYELP